MSSALKPPLVKNPNNEVTALQEQPDEVILETPLAPSPGEGVEAATAALIRLIQRGGASARHMGLCWVTEHNR